MNEVATSITTTLVVIADSLHLAGDWGWLSMALLFAISAVSIVPRPMLCVLAGSVYGLYGIPIAMAGSIVGAAAAFLLGSALRNRTERFIIARRPALQLVFQAIREEGWRVVLLCRLSPLAPSSVLSLLFGASSVAFWPFAFATMAGILPGVTLEVMLGSSARSALDGQLSYLQMGMLIVGLCAGLAALFLIGRKLRQALRATGAVPPQRNATGS